MTATDGVTVAMDKPEPGRSTAGIDATAGAIGLTIVAFGLWLWGVQGVEPEAMSDSGLISVLGWPVLLSFAVLAAAAVVAVSRPVVPKRILAAQVVMLVVMLQGLPGLIEAQADYFTAYLHAGFVEEIARTGRTYPEFDARFSWPGAFGLGALIAEVGGVQSARYFLRWSPVLFNLAYLAPLRLIVRTVTEDERVRWVALWLFVVANWVHQDYYSPQALNLFLYLVVLAVVLRWFGSGDDHQPVVGRRFASRPLSPLMQLRRRLALDDQAGGEHVAGNRRTNWALIGVLVLLIATIVVSHQLTPVAALLVLTALVVVRRCSVTHLPVVTALLFAGWFSVGATGYWSGHLDTLTGGAGNVGQNLGSSLLGRVGGSPARLWVLRLRIGLSLLMLSLAALGAVRRWRQGSPPVALAAIALPPFLLVAGQSYGGEVLLRSYLLALPATCVLAAVAVTAILAPGRKLMKAVALTVVLALLALAGLTARFGNEQFERVGTNDLTAIQWAYGNIPLGATLIAPVRNLPWRFEQLRAYKYQPEDEQPLSTTEGITALVPRDAPAFLLTSDEEQLFGSQLYGLSEGWLDRVLSDLRASGHLELVFHDGDARVWKIDPAASTARPVDRETGG